MRKHKRREPTEAEIREESRLLRAKYPKSDGFLKVTDALFPLLTDRHYVSVFGDMMETRGTFGGDNMSWFPVTCAQLREEKQSSVIFTIRHFEATPSYHTTHRDTGKPMVIPYKALTTFHFHNGCWIYFGEKYIRTTRALDPNTGEELPPENDIVLCSMDIMFPSLLGVTNWTYLDDIPMEAMREFIGKLHEK